MLHCVDEFLLAEYVDVQVVCTLIKITVHNLNQIIRVTPTVVYNLGKLSFGLEYDITSAQYGKYDVAKHVNSSNGLVDGDLHWVTNHRLLGMVKFTF